MIAAGVLVPKRPKQGGEKPPEMTEPKAELSPPGAQPTARASASKGKPTSTRLYEIHAKKLSEVAREEELEGGAAEAFDKHFGALLDNILIAAKAARLKKLREEAGA